MHVHLCVYTCVHVSAHMCLCEHICGYVGVGAYLCGFCGCVDTCLCAHVCICVHMYSYDEDDWTPAPSPGQSVAGEDESLTGQGQHAPHQFSLSLWRLPHLILITKKK